MTAKLIPLVAAGALVFAGQAKGAGASLAGRNPVSPARDVPRQPDEGCPEWFRDAKFGIWVHWGPQSVPMKGDGYARWMYGPQLSSEMWELEHATQLSKFHREHYDHPSRFGYKDVVHLWTAEKWDPNRVMTLYKKAGARYFVAVAAGRDNFDLWNSAHQPWNSMKVGPKKDVVGLWAAAARLQGLPFGVSLHSGWTWRWMNVASAADSTGPMAYIPYDGQLTRADGRGTWWEGLDPRQLYGRPHRTEEAPDPAFVDGYYARARDLLGKYHPDLVFFDDSQWPFGPGSASPASPPGRQAPDFIADSFGPNAKRKKGQPPPVVNLRGLTNDDLPGLVPEIPHEQVDRVQPHPWQTDLCIGDWFYEEGIAYKPIDQLIDTLVDVVSKNGNLLLNFPLRPEGTMDEREIQLLEDLAAWMKINGEAIYETRPWMVYGEGPTRPRPGQLSENYIPFTAQDVRFTTKGKRTLYAVFLAWPAEPRIVIRSLAKSPSVTAQVKSVKLLGSAGWLRWTHSDEGLVVELPKQKPGDHAFALKVAVEDLQGFRPPEALQRQTR